MDRTTTYILATSKDDIKVLESAGLLSLLAVDNDLLYVIEMPKMKGYTVTCPICKTINLDVAHFIVHRDEDNNFISDAKYKDLRGIIPPKRIGLSEHEKKKAYETRKRILNRWKFSERLSLFYCSDHGLYGHCKPDFKPDTWLYSKYVDFYSHLRMLLKHSNL